MEDIIKIQSGDKKTLEQFIKKNQGLVRMVVLKYTNYGLDFDDMMQEGNIGLIIAIKKYNPDLGFSFSTYSVYWIRNMIRKYICSQSRSIRVPMHVEDKLVRIREIRNLLFKKLNREATLEELSKECKIPEKEIEILLQTQYSAISFDAPIDDLEVSTLQDVYDSKEDSPQDICEKNELGPILKKVIENSNLSERELEVIKLRNGFYGEAKTLEEVANILKITGERVRQIEHHALIKIRKSKILEELIEFTDNPDKNRERYRKNTY